MIHAPRWSRPQLALATSFRPVLVLLALAAAVAALPAAAQPPIEPIGEPFTVPQPPLPECNGPESSTARLPGGRFVVVWRGQDVFAQVIGPGGAPEGEPIDVDEDPADPLSYLTRVAATPEGGFVVAWNDVEIHGWKARRFDAAGEPVTPVRVLTSGATLTLWSLRIVAFEGGDFATVTAEGDRIVARRFDAGGLPSAPERTVAQGGNLPGAERLQLDLQPAAVAVGDDLLVAWIQNRSTFAGDMVGFLLAESAVMGRRVIGPGATLGAVRRYDATTEFRRFIVRLLPTAHEPAVSWLEAPFETSVTTLLARRIRVDGVPAGEVVTLAVPDGVNAFGASVSADSGGSYLVAWPDGIDITVQAFSPDGVPVRQPLAMGIDYGPSESPSRPAVLPDAAGRFDLLWLRFQPPQVLPTGCENAPELNGRRLAAGCLAGLDGVCLSDTRFKVTVDWEDQHNGGAGFGRPLPQTADTGSFWFFRPGNVELLAKVLDGRPVNGYFWFFYGSLSDVGYRITVTDTQEDRSRSYVNPPGTLASFGDTAAFEGSVGGEGYLAPAAGGLHSGPSAVGEVLSALAVLGDVEELGAPAAAASGPASAATFPVPCPDDPEIACLGGGRFLVEVDWVDPHNDGSGRGTAVPLTGDTEPDSTGFWFFRQTNLEMAVKLLDGRPVNGNFWFFYGSLTDVGFRITVTDRQSGQHRFYDNPPLTFGSRGDTAAFPGS